MNKKEQFLKDLKALAVKYSLTRIKTETPNFKRDYQLQEDGEFILTSEKAVITALGKTSVVAIGEGEKYKNYEEAEESVRVHWAAYFKSRREMRSADEKIKEAKRQKRYREKRKKATVQFKRQG